MDCSSVYASDVLSRAIDIEDEEDICEITEKECNLLFEWCSDVKQLVCKKLLIFSIPTLSGFMDTCILSSPNVKVVAHIKNLNEEASKVTKVYKVQATEMDDNFSYVINVNKLSQEELFAWTGLVFDNLCDSSTQVSILMIQNSTSYKSSSDSLPETFVRMLKPKNSTSVGNIKSLNQPNIIDGLPAQFLIHAEIHGFWCQVFVVFSKLLSPSSYVCNLFLNIGHEDVAQLIDQEKLQQLRKQEVESSNSLYI